MDALHGMSRISDLLRTGNVPRLWGTGLLIGITRWTEVLSIGIYTYQQTQSPFLVALLACLNWIPSALFGALVGTLAERVDRRRLLLGAMGFSCGLAGLLAFLTFTDRVELWHIALGTFMSGLVWTTEYPVRRTLLGEIAGVQRTATALSFDVATGTATMSLGPLIGGFLMRDFGLHAFYVLAMTLLLVALGLVATVRYSAPPNQEKRGGFLESLLAGLQHVRGNEPVAGVLLMTVFVNFFGFSFISMLPVIGSSKLLVGPDLIGILSSMEGAGSFLGLLVLTVYASSRYYMRLYVSGIFILLFAIIIFSALPWYGVCLVVLFVGGVGESGFAAMQATITFVATPTRMRSRIMGLLVVCIGFGPLGILHTGAMAEWLGGDVAIRVVAIEGLICCLGCLWFLPALRRASIT